jgi:hypothetical protein
VPEEILEAFVVSVVAEAARPDTAAEVIAMLVFVTPVACPCAFTAITGTCEAEPYVAAVTAVLLMLNAAPVRVRPVPAVYVPAPENWENTIAVTPNVPPESLVLTQPVSA